MRLVCPNCAAQYEVDDSVIPASGRDVQCSNCGHAWFQPGAYHDTMTDEVAAPDDLDAVATPESEVEVSAESAVLETVARQTADEHADSYADDLVPESAHVTRPSPVPDEAEPAGERRKLDPSVLDVLREEAERETEARRSEGTSSLEMQPELGLPDAAVSAVVAAAAAQPTREDDTASLVADDAGLPHDDVAARGHRRGLLPDIEEINSTLSASSGRSHGGEAVVTADAIRRRKSGFRMGFSTTLLAAALLLAVYLFAPTIAVRVPALGPALQSYVSGVNGVRLWIDDKIKSSTEALRDTGTGSGATVSTSTN